MDFKFGRSYEKNNWCVMKDNQRRIFQIPINDIPQEEIEEYVRRIANKFRTPESFHNENGSIYLPYTHNPSDNRDYFIPTRERNPDIPDMIFVDHISLLTP